MMRYLIVSVFLIATSAFAADSAPVQITHSVQVQFSHDLNESGTRTISVPTFDNSRGTLLGITYSFAGVSSTEGIVSFGNTGAGSSIATHTSRIVVQLAPQNGPIWALDDEVPFTCQTSGSFCPGGSLPFSYSENIESGVSWNPASRGAISMAGGSVEITIDAYVESGTGAASGSTTVQGTLTVTYIYDSKSSCSYAEDILRKIPAIDADDPVMAARAFYRNAILYRENSNGQTYDGSSVNENLKEIEYFARGFSGGMLWGNLSRFGDDGDVLNDFFNMHVPLSAPAYEAAKRVFGLAEGQPSSAALGHEIAIRGWLYGFGRGGLTLREALDRHCGGMIIAPPPSSPPGSPTNPVPPLLASVLPTQAESAAKMTTRLFHLNIADSAAIHHFQAVSGGDVTIAATGSTLDGFVVHSAQKATRPFVVEVQGTQFPAVTGELFSFAGRGLTTPIDTLVLRGVATGNDAVVIGVDFSKAGPVFLATFGAATTAPVMTLTAVEYQHEALGHYFVTPLASEIAALDGGQFAGWKRTGQVFTVFSDGAAEGNSVCRYFRSDVTSHFYSADSAECEAVASFEGWIFETAKLFRAVLPNPETGACPGNTVPLYRLWNRAVNHRYTTDVSVRDAMTQRGYVLEGYGPGVAMCVPD